MASRKRKMPEKSRIDLIRSVAYARKQKPGASDEEPAVDDAAVVKVETAGADAETHPVALPIDAAPPPMPVAEERPARARTSTAAMPPTQPVGEPPEVPPPAASAPSISSAGVEDPTHMPGPREIPSGAPDDPAAPPGLVPPGDSRSMRKRTDRYEFALVYRQGTFVITRCGLVGTRGQWRVVEYPTSASASHAYAKECSRFVSEGFSDYRG